MADITNLNLQFLDYAGLQQYDGLAKVRLEEVVAELRAEMAEGDAVAFKGIALTEDGKLNFYTELPFEGEDVNVEPAYSVTLPKEDLSMFMKLVDDAVEGNVASLDANGQVVDSGVKVADLATKAEVAQLRTDLEALIGDNTEAVEKAQADVDSLAAKVGTVPENQTVMEIITNIQENAYDDTQIKADIAKNAEDIANEAERAAGIEAGLEERLGNVEKDYLKAADKEALQGQIDDVVEAIEVINGDETIEGSTDKKIKDAINAFATQISDDNTLNTFQEVLTYLSTHKGEATEMMTAITDLEALVGEESVAKQIADAIAEENLDQYATDAELAEAVARILALEGTDHEHANKAELDKVGDGDVAKWNEAYNKAHEHENEEVLEGITAEKVAAWDSAEADAIAAANAHADEEIAKDRERLTNLENANKEGGAVATAIADAKKAGTDAQATADEAKGLAETAQGEIDALEVKVGTVADGKTVVGLIDEANAATQAVADRTTQVETDIDALEQQSGANTEAIGALEEAHAADKEALERAIAENAEAIAAIEAIPSDKIVALFNEATE